MKNKIYPKISQSRLDDMTVSMSPRLMSLLSYDIRKEQICKKKKTSVGVQYHWILLGIRILNLSQNDEFKASIQTHWKLELETLIETSQFTNILAIMQHKKRLSRQMCFISWSFPSKNVMKMMFFNLKIPIIKKSVPLLKINNICYVWRLPFFSK